MHQITALSERGCLSVWQVKRFTFVHTMDIGTIESCCAQLECFEDNGMLLHTYCRLSVSTAGILWHSVVSKMYLIYKQVKYCKIVASYLFDFTLLVSRFSVHVLYKGGKGGHPFLFFCEDGSSFS